MFKERPQICVKISNGLKEYFKNNPIKNGDGNSSIPVYSLNIITKEILFF